MSWPKAVLAAAKTVGVDTRLLDVYTTVNTARGSGRFGQYGLEFSVDERISEFSIDKSEAKGYILFPLTQGQNGHLSYSYAILAHAFRVRGYIPLIPLCDADIDLCLRKEPRGHEDFEDAVDRDHLSTCAMCSYYGQTMLDEFGIEPIAVSDLGDPTTSVPNDARELWDFTYSGIDVSTYAKATTRRYLKKATIDRDDEFEREAYRRFVKAGVVLTDVAERLFDSYDVSATLAHHPVYIYGGISLAFARKRGVPAVSTGIGYDDETLIFGNASNRAAIPTFSDDQLIQDVVSTPLSPSERDEIENVMEARKSGENVRVSAPSRGDSSVQGPTDRCTIGLFPNLTWDAATEADDIVFSGTYDWIESTIEELGSRDDVFLLVKPHPAEAVRGTNDGVVDRIRRSDLEPGDNVTVLPPDTDVNPYLLMKDVDVAVVYTSTVGLEMAYHGIPVVLVNDAHYRGLEFTYDPTERSEYFSLLESVEDLSCDPSMQRRAKRYAHFLFVRKQVDFPYYTDNEGDIELLPVSHDELLPGTEPFDRIVERTLADEPIFME